MEPKKTAPRELIHLLTSLREKETSRLERGEPPAPNEQLFDRSVFKDALSIVSETGFQQKLIAEYPDLKETLAMLNGEKTEQTRFLRSRCDWREFAQVNKDRGAGNRELRMSGSNATLFKSLTTGVYVVGVAHEEVRNAFTATWVMQVSFNPLLLALSINPHHSSYELLKQGGAFSVNVLKKDQLELAAHFGGRASAGKLASTEWTPGRTGVPLLHRSLAWFESQVVGEHPAGDHMVVLGKVIDGRLIDSKPEPMIYNDTGVMDGAAALFPTSFAI